MGELALKPLVPLNTGQGARIPPVRRGCAAISLGSAGVSYHACCCRTPATPDYTGVRVSTHLPDVGVLRPAEALQVLLRYGQAACPELEADGAWRMPSAKRVCKIEGGAQPAG